MDFRKVRERLTKNFMRGNADDASQTGFVEGFNAAIEMLEDYKDWKLRGKVARSFEEWANTVYLKKIR